ncbi:MAG: hypothetical protein QOJ51_2098 [Acidobacteriaceae bacterium]|jgi:hypothetical protein|nr:hypothetical protein [Acidobacteriaceae bacterium]MDX6458794.1 hypothetical protein [Acidobacteriaceae bacterium]MEA2259273.1 hypothetical protein [Acidobacteriaceae bacterium]
MRSNLVFGAYSHTPNRYQLCLLVAKGARKLHTPKARLQDTTNDVFVLLEPSSAIARIPLKSANPRRRPAA